MARLAVGLGRWPKTQRLPSLDDLLKPAKRSGQRQSTEEMLAAFQDMKSAGAPIRIKKVKKTGTAGDG